MFTKLVTKLILLHLLIQSLKYHPVFSDIEEGGDLGLDFRETSSFSKHKHFDNDWKKVPWGYSAVELAVLYRHEVFLHNVMVKYEKVLELRLQYVRQYLQDYKESVPKEDGPFWKAPTTPEETGEIIAAHPIMSYRLTRRFSKQLNWIELSLEYDEGVKQRFREVRSKTVWPNQRDVDRAMESVVKMQYTYDFDTLPFSTGMLQNVDLMVGFSKLQMLEIGEKAIHLGQFALAVEWLRAGSKKVDKSVIDMPVNNTELERFIKEAEEHHDDEFDATEGTDLSLFETKISGLEELPDKRRSLYAGFDPFGLDDYNVHLRYNILCLGVAFKDPIQSNSLYCWLDNYSHPYFTIQPLRTELHSFDPYVVQIHDLVSESKRLELLMAARTHEKLMSTRPDANNYPVAYLDEERKKFKKFQYFEKFAEMVTGLNVQGRENSEPLEVSEHSFGARYSLQSTSNQNKLDEEESIAANVLLQMTGSVIGGRIAFPKINVIVDSSPGSVVFWYSTLKNGQPDERTMHAHCPTVLYSKWVALKKIKLKGNMQKRPCSRIPEK